MLSLLLEEELIPAICERLMPVRCEPACVVVLDEGSDGLLRQVRSLYPAADCLDHFPEKALGKVDLLVANLSLPWQASLLETLKEWRQWVRGGGMVMLTMLGPDTLQEWPGQGVNFARIDMHNLGDALVQAGFLEPVLDVDSVVLAYRDKAKCLQEMREAKLIAADEAMALPTVESGRAEFTFELIYAHAFSPIGQGVPGEVSVPLSRILDRRSSAV